MAEKSSQMTPPDPNKNLANEGLGQLKDDIEQTRTAMSATIDAIQDKIDPRRVAGRAKTDVTDKIRAKIEPLGYAAQTKLTQAASGVRKATERAAHFARDNPDELPKIGAAILGGLGALSLAIGGIKKLRGRRD